MAVEQAELLEQRLLDAVGVAGVLAAGWEIFELVAAAAAASAGQAADLYPAFTFARGSAVSGRNTIALAPSLLAASPRCRRTRRRRRVRQTRSPTPSLHWRRR